MRVGGCRSFRIPAWVNLQVADGNLPRRFVAVVVVHDAVRSLVFSHYDATSVLALFSAGSNSCASECGRLPGRSGLGGRVGSADR
jgi:hypothetical protein